MAFPKSIRIQLGLSLAEFADLLGTNVGQLSMAESGLRNLPGPATNIARAIEGVLSDAEMQVETSRNTGPAINTMLQKQIRLGQLKLEKMKDREQKLTAKRDAARRIIAVAGAMDGVFPEAEQEEIAMQLAVLRRKADKKVSVCEFELIRLQLQQVSVKAAISATQAYLIG